MNKTPKSIRFYVIKYLFIVAILTMVVLAPTLARYFSAISSDDEGRVALWSVKINEEDLSDNELDFKTGKTLRLDNINPNVTGSDSYELVIQLTNSSEVTASAILKFEQEVDIPLQYSVLYDNVTYQETNGYYLIPTLKSGTSEIHILIGWDQTNISWQYSGLPEKINIEFIAQQVD